ncbi:MAG: hypothetical protein NXH82_14295 [Rhodobacteraceae bacterium]|nr:hypothetical protein [Paracoccaceae bacterium]
MFEILIWVGAGLSALGLLGLIWCILRVARARRAGLPDAELRAAVQAVVPLNLGALFVSVIGLMLVVVGIMLG